MCRLGGVGFPVGVLPCGGLKLPHTQLNRVRQVGGGAPILGLCVGESDSLGFFTLAPGLAQLWEKAPWWGGVSLVDI